MHEALLGHVVLVRQGISFVGTLVDAFTATGDLHKLIDLYMFMFDAAIWCDLCDRCRFGETDRYDDTFRFAGSDRCNLDSMHKLCPG